MLSISPLLNKIKLSHVFSVISLAIFLLSGLFSEVYAKDKYILISHAKENSLWWNTVKNALQQAATDFNVEVEYKSTTTGDLKEMVKNIENSSNKKYAGIITTIANYEILKPALKKITAKGIPLITINSGTQSQSESVGALMHVGQPEYEAGEAAGLRMGSSVRSYLCVNHFSNNPVSLDRCRGFAEAKMLDYKISMVDITNDDLDVATNKIIAYLQKNPGTQSILSLGISASRPSLKAIEQLGLTGKTQIATFDLSPEITKAVKEGTITFAVDQQPYLQGYIPIAIFSILKKEPIKTISAAIDFLKKDKKAQKRFEEYGLEPIYHQKHINAGPGFVTKRNVDKVEKYAGTYR